MPGSLSNKLHPIQLVASLAIGCLLLFSDSNAGVPLSDYLSRLGRAQTITAQMAEDEPSAEDVINGMRTVGKLLPEQEIVDFDGRTMNVDNKWLHEAIEVVIKRADSDVEQRRSLIFEVSDKLKHLKDRIDSPAKAATIDERARLEGILARSDYRAEQQQESRIRYWLKRFRDALLRLLSRLAPSSPEEIRGPGAGIKSFFRGLILLLTLAAFAFGLYYLLKRVRLRRKTDHAPESREVLGEEIAEDVTAADLLAMARELARAGDYRTAIRRAYIALLFELEQRGKLRLQSSKTNRDYLEALRGERDLYPPFSNLTVTFEKVWFGRAGANEDDFQGFISRYQETVGGG